MSYQSRHPHDPEVVECTECGAAFDMARQHYYEQVCPSCHVDPRGNVSTVECSNPACETELPHDEMHWSTKATPFDVHEEGPLCPDDIDWSWKPTGEM